MQLNYTQNNTPTDSVTTEEIHFHLNSGKEKWANSFTQYTKSWGLPVPQKIFNNLIYNRVPHWAQDNCQILWFPIFFVCFSNLLYCYLYC